MARENPIWGYTRIRGALRNLGHEIGRNTIKRILAANGIDPASTRRKGMSWETFLKLHWGAIAAADFFTVEVLTHAGLIRFLVFFVIDLKSRRVKLAGVAPEPDGRWMSQMARNLTDAEEGFLSGTRYLIHDRDPLFTDELREILRCSGVDTVKLPAQSPDLNAYAVRFVRSIREECLSRVVPLGERMSRRPLARFTRPSVQILSSPSYPIASIASPTVKSEPATSTMPSGPARSRARARASATGTAASNGTRARAA